MITSVDCKAETQQKQPKQIISKTKWITVKTVVKKSSQITFCCKRGDFDYIIFVSPLVIDHN